MLRGLRVGLLVSGGSALSLVLWSLGPTMEWGFLADLLRRPEALALVDELFVELHFYGPSLRWVHLTHSMKQAFDVDVDNDSLGPTMEWGFLADLLRRPEALALVDELFIELHFFAPSLNWVHLTHSMKQAFDVLRELRACGLPVHAWP